MHLIDKNWELKSFPLGIVKKGYTQAVDHVKEIEALYAMFGLGSMFGLWYKNIIVNVTETEATIVASSMFKQHAAAVGVPEHGWLACIAHILNLITKEAYVHDGPTMRKAYALVHSFVASDQLNNLLKSLHTNLPPGKKAVLKKKESFT